MAKAKHAPPCARCAALEDWMRKALKLFEMIAAEWPGTTWLQRQVQRAKAQCPMTANPDEEEPPHA